MAYTFIARMKIFPDREAQFIDACERMEQAVRDHEPDALLYKFYKLREPYAYAVLESFETEAGDRAHQDSAHFREIVPDIIECLDGGYEREFLDPLK